jgi:hypothetical protein
MPDRIKKQGSKSEDKLSDSDKKNIKTLSSQGELTPTRSTEQKNTQQEPQAEAAAVVVKQAQKEDLTQTSPTQRYKAIALFDNHEYQHNYYAIQMNKKTERFFDMLGGVTQVDNDQSSQAIVISEMEFARSEIVSFQMFNMHEQTLVTFLSNIADYDEARLRHLARVYLKKKKKEFGFFGAFRVTTQKEQDDSEEEDAHTKENQDHEDADFDAIELELFNLISSIVLPY